MSRAHVTTSVGAALLAIALGSPAQAQQQPPARPQIETKKVDGTDNVYIFRNGNHQAMFIVTKAGVIATDRLKVLKDPHTPIPDESVSNRGRTIKLGGTALELKYVGLNHSDSTLVMRLPKEKIIFVVDLIAVGSFPGRGMIDFYPLESEVSIKQIIAMDWERMIPGHPGQPGGRLGTKEDVQNVLTLLQEASAEVKTAARAGKCWQPTEKEFTLPKYANWPGYEVARPLLARRYCGLWGRGT